MKSINTLRRAGASALLAGLLAAFALPSMAQNAAPADPPRQEQAKQQKLQKHPRAMTPEQRQQRFEQSHQQRLAGFKDKLQLTAGQQAAWEQFTQAMQPQPHARLDRQELQKLTTPERIDHMRTQRQQRAANADRRGEATKAFYAQLSSEQQKTFDAQQSYQAHGKHHGWNRHGGKHGDQHRQQHKRPETGA